MLLRFMIVKNNLSITSKNFKKMAKIIFQGFNDSDNKMILNGSKRRVLSS